MAAKGTKLKEEITKKILEIFPNSFLYNDNKEIRIPGEENGEILQIKCTLTCSKNNVSIGEDNLIPGENTKPLTETPTIVNNNEIYEMTEEEKDNIKNLLKTFNL